MNKLHIGRGLPLVETVCQAQKIADPVDHRAAIAIVLVTHQVTRKHLPLAVVLDLKEHPGLFESRNPTGRHQKASSQKGRIIHDLRHLELLPLVKGRYVLIDGEGRFLQGLQIGTFILRLLCQCVGREAQSPQTKRERTEECSHGGIHTGGKDELLERRRTGSE